CPCQRGRTRFKRGEPSTDGVCPQSKNGSIGLSLPLSAGENREPPKRAEGSARPSTQGEALEVMYESTSADCGYGGHHSWGAAGRACHIVHDERDASGGACRVGEGDG